MPGNNRFKLWCRCSCLKQQMLFVPQTTTYFLQFCSSKIVFCQSIFIYTIALQNTDFWWASKIIYCKTLHICDPFISLIGNFGYDCRNISHTYIYLFLLPFIVANSIKQKYLWFYSKRFLTPPPPCPTPRNFVPLTMAWPLFFTIHAPPPPTFDQILECRVTI